MATILLNLDGTLQLTLTPDEQNTFAGLPVGQFDAYMTLWLQDHAKDVLFTRFEKLSAQERTDVLMTLSKTDAVKVL